MKKFVIFVFAVLLTFGFAVTETRAGLVYELEGLFNGTAPTSPAPWLTAEFTTVALGTVTLRLTSSLEVDSEFISQVGFNVKGGIEPSTLSIAPDALYTAVSYNSALLGSGNSVFDIVITLPNHPPSARFDLLEILTFTITGEGITAEDFARKNSDNLFIAAHIQGIPLPGGGTTSGAVSTPIPAAAWLLGSGLIGLAALRRRMRK
jgi:hypothetical protein